MSKSPKKSPKATSAMLAPTGSRRKEPRKPGPFVTKESIAEVCRSTALLPTNLPGSPALHRTLRAIQESAMQDAGALGPMPLKLAKVGRQLRGVIPAGYEGAMVPALTAKQLRNVLSDDDSISYVRRTHPGCLGDPTQKHLRRIVDALLIARRVGDASVDTADASD